MQKFITIILLIVLAVSMYCAPISIGKSYNPIVVEATTLEEDLSLWKEDWLSIYSSNEEIFDTGNNIDETLKSVTFCNTLICCVPYESTNKEAVLHCETFANKVLDKGLWLQSAVYIVYTDEVVIEYHNRDWQFGGGGINIYIP